MLANIGVAIGRLLSLDGRRVGIAFHLLFATKVAWGISLRTGTISDCDSKVK